MRARVQRLVAEAGLTSRRKAESWIVAGRVKVNGHRVDLGQSADPEVDVIEVDGRRLPHQNARSYWLLNKPSGYTTSLADRHADHLVTELWPSSLGRIFPVGRLDRETAGVLLLTNDGWLAHRLMHPRFQIPKVYEAWVEGQLTPLHVQQLRRGVALEDGPARAEAVQVLNTTGTKSQVRLTLTEGRKREIRRLFERIGRPVLELTRTRYAGLSVEGVAVGQLRPLTSDEVDHLFQLVNGLPHLRQPDRAMREEKDRGRQPTRRTKAGSSTGLGSAESRHSVRHTRRDYRGTDR